MNDQYVKNVVEAALLAAGRPLAMDELVSIFDERDGSNADEIRAAIAALTADYESRGLELLEVASGYRIQIKAAVAQPVARLWQERPAKYSRALLETLALVAYRQPITRGEIEQIRGVRSIRTSSRPCSSETGSGWSATAMCPASPSCWEPRGSFSIISV